MAREVTTKPTTYLRIAADGSLFNGSSEPKEGYIEYVSKSGGKSYRKFYKGTDFGKITQLGIVEKEFDSGKVRFLSITVENENSRDVIQLPLKTMKGGLTDEVKKFVAILPNIDFSKTLTLSSNRTKNERGYTDRMLFVNYVENGQIISPGLKFALKFGEDGDIPMFKKTQGMDGIVYDYTEQDTYLYGKLLEEIKRFNESRGVVSENKVESPAKPQNPTEAKTKDKPIENKSEPNVFVDEEDDLPF